MAKFLPLGKQELPGNSAILIKLIYPPGGREVNNNQGGWVYREEKVARVTRHS